jgi:hypothetical protein
LPEKYKISKLEIKAARQFHWHEIRRRKNRNRKARAGKKEGGWGEGIFARPSVQFLPREARQSVGVLFKKGSSFVQQLRLNKTKWVWRANLFARTGN